MNTVNETIKKQRMAAGGATILAPLLLGISYLLSSIGVWLLEAVCFVLAVISAVTAVCMWGVLAVRSYCRKKNKKQMSAFGLFAIIDAVLLVGTTIYAVYDMMTATGWFAGLFGLMILFFGSSVMAGLLILDFIVWMIYKRKKGERKA